MHDNDKSKGMSDKWVQRVRRGPAPRQPHPGGQGRMAIIDTNDIIGRTFLTVPQEDGTKMRL